MSPQRAVVHPGGAGRTVCDAFVISRRSPCAREPDVSAETRAMLAMVLFINAVLSDGPTGEASFLSFQVFHFLLNMSLKLRTRARMWRPRPSPVHLQLATGEERRGRSIILGRSDPHCCRCLSTDSQKALFSSYIFPQRIMVRCWGLTVLCAWHS